MGEEGGLFPGGLDERHLQAGQGDPQGDAGEAAPAPEIDQGAIRTVQKRRRRQGIEEVADDDLLRGAFLDEIDPPVPEEELPVVGGKQSQFRRSEADADRRRPFGHGFDHGFIHASLLTDPHPPVNPSRFP